MKHALTLAMTACAAVACATLAGCRSAAEEPARPAEPVATAEAPPAEPAAQQEPTAEAETAAELAPAGEAEPVEEAEVVAAAPTGEEPAGPEPAAPAGPDAIVLARVDGVPLTLQDAMGAFEESHGGHSGLMRGEAAVRELTGRIVERQLFVAEALALGLDREQEVQDAVEERRQMLAEKLFWKREVDEQVSVPREEIEAYYAKTDMMLAVTLVQTAERETAEALRARVVAGESIVDVASAESIHPSRNSGGLVPIVRRGDFPPEMDAAVFALEEEKALTPVVPLDDGFAFARLDQRTVNENRPPPEVMFPQIEKVLADVARRERRAEVEQQVRTQAGVEVDQDLAAPEVVLDEQRDPATVVARSAGQELTLGELQGYLQLDRLRAAGPELAGEAIDAIVLEWTDRKAVRQAARELGLFEDPEVQPEVEAWRNDVLLAYLLANYVYADVEVSDQDARDYYSEHLEDEFTSPAEARVAYLVVADRAAADSALARLAAGEEFADVAREVSTDDTFSAHGGRIGWVKEGELIVEVEAPVMEAEVGALVGPIETEYGFFVVHVLEKRARKPMPVDRSLGRARRAVQALKRQEVYGLWVSRLRERADVELSEPGMQQAVAWLEVEAQRREAERAAEPEAPSPHGGGSPHGGPAMPAGHGQAPEQVPEQAAPEAGGGNPEVSQ